MFKVDFIFNLANNLKYNRRQKSNVINSKQINLKKLIKIIKQIFLMFFETNQSFYINFEIALWKIADFFFFFLSQVLNTVKNQ